MQPQPPVDYSVQFTPPKSAGMVTNQARTANMYGSSTQSPTSSAASSNRASPVATSNISSPYCSSQMSANVANQTLNRSTGISPTGYAKVMPHSTMAISLSTASSTPQTSTLLQTPTAVSTTSYGLASPSVMKNVAYFSPSPVSVSLPTVPVPSSASNISHQVISFLICSKRKHNS